jgi:hypothetical protein
LKDRIAARDEEFPAAPYTRNNTVARPVRIPERCAVTFRTALNGDLLHIHTAEGIKPRLVCTMT